MFLNYGNRTTEWLLCGAVSVALHGVILFLVFMLGSSSPSNPSESKTTEEPKVKDAVQAESSTSVSDIVHDDEKVAGVTASTTSASDLPEKPANSKPRNATPSVKNKEPEHAAPAKEVRRPNKPRPPEKGAKETGKSSAPSTAAKSVPEKTDAVKLESYVVKSGDTLTALAKGCDSTPAELAKLNGVSLKELSDLKVGQKIKLKVKTAD